jgi:hypothetical protein
MRPTALTFLFRSVLSETLLAVETETTLRSATPEMCKELPVSEAVGAVMRKSPFGLTLVGIYTVRQVFARLPTLAACHATHAAPHELSLAWCSVYGTYSTPPAAWPATHTVGAAAACRKQRVRSLRGLTTHEKQQHGAALVSRLRSGAGLLTQCTALWGWPSR